MPWIIGVVVALAGLFGFAATRPNEFRVRRAARIRALPSRVFPYLDDFHQWPAWSPWEKLDPALKREYSGSARGRGAVYAWEGNRKVGRGRMEITETSAPNHLTLTLDFLQPFEAHNTTEFTLAPGGDATDVTWEMYGPSPYISKVMGVFMNMDRMIGRDFEKGLENLKAVAEA